MSALLDIDGLDLRLDGGTRLLRGVSLRVEAGRIVGLVGESGAGKTMVSRCVLGIAPANARVAGGAIRFDGRDITHVPEDERRHLLGRDIGFIPQNPMTALNPVARIEPQVTDVLRMHLGLTREAARARALELLAEVHLREPQRVLRQYPHELSGGMRQRVLIAAAFACRPRLVIADEPTTALDVTVQKQILRLIRELQARFGTAILFVTHDFGVVAKLCDSVAVMHGGRVLETAPTASLLTQPRHPYTRALLAATPRFDRPAETLQPIPAALTRELADEVRELDAALP
ncbi:MAG TPA: ABC transporter ATP-binding protein [Burkholderiales bacterium]|nr:ABC transporter ATP-binding protein [Burkholderiales bacterium]